MGLGDGSVIVALIGPVWVMVHPVAGKLLIVTLPVETVQVGCITVPNVAPEEIAFITTSAVVAETQPASETTLN